MFQYKFLALCAFTILGFGGSVNTEHNVELKDLDVDIRKIDHRMIELSDGSVKLRNPLLDTGIKIIKAAFPYANCVEETARSCIRHWANPGAMIACAIYDAIPDGMKYDNTMMTVDSDSEVEEMLDESIELRNPVFVHATMSCIDSAARLCVGHWDNRGALINCIKKFFGTDKDRCAFG